MGRPKKLRQGDAVLTHERIVATALQLADAHGIEPLSMRQLATELDCGVMSLYHYVADKNALLEALVDQVASEIAPPDADVGWRVATRHIAESTLETLRRHPWAVPIWTTTWPGLSRFGLVEKLLDALGDAGLPPDIADLGFHAVTNHVQGFAQQRLSYNELGSRAKETGERLEAMLAGGDFPRVADHVEFHRSNTSATDEFGFALDLLLDGLERSADTRSRPPDESTNTNSANRRGRH